MKIFQFLAFLALPLIAHSSLHAHCQVPCGIFDDEVKFAELEQHIETIAKAGRQIREISEQDSLSAQDKQQIIRWTLQKEAHAQKIIDEVTDYFLAQRIKPGADHYLEKLEVLHLIIVSAMKSKQSVEDDPVESLSEHLAAFKELYLHHDHSQ